MDGLNLVVGVTMVIVGIALYLVTEPSSGFLSLRELFSTGFVLGGIVVALQGAQDSW
jgi:hypothetical protein